MVPPMLRTRRDVCGYVWGASVEAATRVQEEEADLKLGKFKKKRRATVALVTALGMPAKRAMFQPQPFSGRAQLT